MNVDHEARRFPRIKIHPDLAMMVGSLGAQVIWPNHETSRLADLSYKGFSAARPGLLPLALHQRLNVELQLGHFPAFRTAVRIAWCTPTTVGLEVASVGAEGHHALGFYLEAKLVGSRLRSISPAFVAAHQTFSHWFQGPADTHVWVWTQGTDPRARAGIERVRVERAGQIVELERGGKVRDLEVFERQALLLLSQMDKETLNMEEFVRSFMVGSSSGD